MGGPRAHLQVKRFYEISAGHLVYFKPDSKDLRAVRIRTGIIALKALCQLELRSAPLAFVPPVWLVDVDDQRVNPNPFRWNLADQPDVRSDWILVRAVFNNLLGFKPRGK